MKNKEFIQTAVILPIVSGLVLSIAFSSFFKSNTDIILPFAQNTVIAYHDNIVSDNKKVSSKKELKDLTVNDNIGSVCIDDNSYILRFNADYSNMISCLSLKSESTNPGDIGTVYISAFYENGKVFDKANKISLDCIFGKFEYEKSDSFTSDNEYKILTSAYKGKTVVVYYQKTDGAGLSSDYQVIVYQEVA